MAKTLVIMRHGKAVASSDSQDDFDRELSEAGRRSLAATLPHSLSLLNDTPKSVQVVSSPAPRAMQTAVLLRKALKDTGFKVEGDVAECAELWCQNVDGFLDYVACCECGTVFAVGHNPFVEELVAQLTGAKLPCATGSLACIALDAPTACKFSSQGSYSNRLLWFAQGPVSQRWKTLVNLESVLGEGADTMIERRDAFLEDPDDIETMHKLRVSIRTLKSIVAHTSRQRELDVFADQARESEDASDELVAFCDEEARAERERVMKTLTSKQCVKSFKKAASIAHNLMWKPQIEGKGLPSKAVRARFDAMVTDLEQDMAGLSLSDVELTHDVRKSAKRVRYAAEGFKMTLGSDAIDIAKGMTAHQDNLGAICDARVNIDLINSFLERDLPERVAWDLNLLRAKNETFLYTALKSAGEQ